MKPAASPHASAWCLVVFAAYLIVALLLGALGPVPWEVTILVLFAGSLLIWTRAVGAPLKALFARRSASVRLLLLVGGLAAAYSATTTAAVLLLGLREAPINSVGPTAIAVAALVMAPVVGILFTAVPEEIIFRGVFLDSFVDRWGAWPALVVSGTLFAAAHLPNAVLAWELSGVTLTLRLLSLTLFGAILAWAVVRTGTLWFAIMWHAGANYPAVLVDMTIGAETVDPIRLEVWGVAFVLGEGLLVWLLVRYGWKQRTGSDPPSGEVQTT